MNRVSDAIYRAAGLKPGDRFKFAEDGEVVEAVVVWSYHDHLSIEVRGKIRSISFEEADNPRFAMASRAIARTVAGAMYPKESTKHAALREEYIEQRWMDFYPGIVAEYRQWATQQIVPVGKEAEIVVRWVLTFDKHAGTEYQFRERRELSRLEDVWPLRLGIERQASTANWCLTRERILSQTYHWPEESAAPEARVDRDARNGRSPNP